MKRKSDMLRTGDGHQVMGATARRKINITGDGHQAMGATARRIDYHHISGQREDPLTTQGPQKPLAAMGVPQRRQQVRWRPEILSFSMMKWYRFTQTGCPLQPTTLHWSQYTDRDRSTSSSTTLSSTLPPLSSSPASPTLRDTLQISRCGGAAAAAGEKMDGNGSSLACFARNPLTASLNVPAAPQSPAAGNLAKSVASTRALALFSGRPFTTISPSATVGSPQICNSPSSSSSSINRIGTRVRVRGGGGCYEITRRKVMGSIPST